MWPQWGCSGPQDKDDTVCVWQNSVMFTQRFCLTLVLSVYQQRLGTVITMRMALHAKPQDRDEFVHLLLC